MEGQIDVMMQTNRRRFLHNDRSYIMHFNAKCSPRHLHASPAAHTSVKNGGFWKMGYMTRSVSPTKLCSSNKCLIVSYLSRRHGTAIRSYASFIVSRSTRLSSIQVAARELTSLCMCVWMCLLLMLRVLASSSRQFRTYSVRAEALLLAQLHVKHEGVAEAVHTQ